MPDNETKIIMFTCENKDCRKPLARTDGVSLFFETGGVSINYLPIVCASCGTESTWYRHRKQKTFDIKREKVFN